MPTPGIADERGLGAAAKQVADHAGAVVRLHVELAQLEVKRKVASLAAGIVLALVAAVLGLFALGFGLAAAAAGFATFLPTWLALLIVFGILALLALVVGLVGLRRIQRGAPPAPEQAIEEAKMTTAALRSHGR